MNAEHELRILAVNPVELEAKILELGGKKTQERLLQRRHTYDTIPKTRDKWMRLRTNGIKTTLAIKHVQGGGISDTKEIEITVSDFEATAQLLNELGTPARAYQENYRTIYELDGAEIMVDEWPRIPPYVEVEAATPDTVHQVIEKLGYAITDATGLDVSGVFSQIYNIEIDDFPVFKFADQ